ncbi:flagellar hook-length control protein FliK [Candidatus Accumulibacter necessarius]|uniref:flagellar hook-length control protein FliK n=1 Tax=Candidatus Accumulibacter necessarius TaxID=2954386 RepID=UPI003DA99B93
MVRNCCGSWATKSSPPQLTLHPPQLGSIEITLNLDQDGANAHFVSPNAEVRGTLRNGRAATARNVRQCRDCPWDRSVSAVNRSVSSRTDNVSRRTSPARWPITLYLASIRLAS